VTLRLRQVALVAHDLDRSVADLAAVFGLGPPFNDPGVEVFGLRNAVFALGTTFLEVVSPLRDDASAARFLARKGGDAGYMVIVQSDDLNRERRRLSNLGVRIVFETEFEDIATLHLHPRDIGGAIVSIDAARPWQSWRWGGPDWEQRGRTQHVRGVIGAGISCLDPARTAARWAEVLGRLAPTSDGESRRIELEEGTLDFSPCLRQLDEGLARVVLDVESHGLIIRNARERGLQVEADELFICGTWFQLTP
jgi:hypothetical protein